MAWMYRNISMNRRKLYEEIWQFSIAGVAKKYSLNYQKLGKDLATVDELAVLDGGKCILQLRGVRPFMSNKFDITKHPNYKYLSDANPKNNFDIEKYLSTQLKTKPDDVYEVVEVDVSDVSATA